MHDNRNTRQVYTYTYTQYVLRNSAATTWRPTQPACAPQRTRPATCKCTVLNTKPFAARVPAAMRSYSLPAARCVPASVLRLCCHTTRKRSAAQKRRSAANTSAHCGCVCPALRLRILTPGAWENNTSAASEPQPLGTHIEQDHLSHNPCWVQWDECCVAQPRQPLWTVIQEGGGIPGVPYRLHTQNSRSRQDTARRCELFRVQDNMHAGGC